MNDLNADAQAATSDTSKYNGLKTLNDYTLLYDDEWLKTLPTGPIPGILTNYTQDLLFSMERLSLSPYQVRRLNSSSTLNFKVDDATTKKITGMTQQQLLTSGRLFYSDYRDQAKLEATTKARYSAAVDAYFYINQTSGNFLPLAIRTNQGASVIYTPADSANDWMLAKIMYNVCDIWFAQWEHLPRTHEVVHIVYMSAIRSLSDYHPVKAVLDRCKLVHHRLPNNRLISQFYSDVPSLCHSASGTANVVLPRWCCRHCLPLHLPVCTQLQQQLLLHPQWFLPVWLLPH